MVDVKSDEVRALVGSTDFFDTRRRGQIDGATIRRSPGSTLKPFLYGLAFDLGLAAPSTYLADVPTSFATFSPENFDRRYRGPVAASEALAVSLIVPAVGLQRQVGTERFLTTLRRLGLRGFSGAKRYGLTLTLGGGEVSLLDLVNAYATLSRGGVYRSCRFFRPNGSAEREGSRVFSEAAAYLILEALAGEDHLRRATGRPSRTNEAKRGYKTGTSWNYRDAWCVAFTSELVVGVWLGDFRGRPHPELIGLESAAPIALDLLDDLTDESTPDWRRPDGVIERRVCDRSGYPASPLCPASHTADFTASATRLPECGVHRRVLVDRRLDCEVCAFCGRGNTQEVEIVEAWPNEVMLWLGKRQKIPPRRRHNPACARMPSAGEECPRIVSPASGSEYRYLHGAPFQQDVYLVAAAGADAQRLHWFIDGGLHATVEPSAKTPWALRPGAHEIRCVDDRGRASRGVIRVGTEDGGR